MDAELHIQHTLAHVPMLLRQPGGLFVEVPRLRADGERSLLASLHVCYVKRGRDAREDAAFKNVDVHRRSADILFDQAQLLA